MYTSKLVFASTPFAVAWIIMVTTYLVRVSRSKHKPMTVNNAFWNPEYDERTYFKNLTKLFRKKKYVNHTTSLASTQRCQHHYSVLILVNTHSGNFERRESIRKTWARDSIKGNPRWATRFLVVSPNAKRYSKKLFDEIHTMKDMILGSSKEDYYKLTVKIQMGFEWAVKYCSFDYLLKCDDDVFINLPQLFRFLENAPREEVYTGYVHYAAVVARSGQYRVTKEEYPKSIYPRYCAGGAYMLSRDVAERMVPVFTYLKVISMEDAYMGLTALKIGIDVTASDQFRMSENEEICQLDSPVISFHSVKTKECMMELFKQSTRQKISKNEYSSQ